ncbi:hypothetical protein U9M48_020963 [Paspalum notatum var. saurae]|uniref:Reverse transcriptase zinc-binding domain-containing protein n=1 Tax=Paspalum notatum var. saurae TaxID=547442 RepID=A0AAQ3WT47_PASNO
MLKLLHRLYAAVSSSWASWVREHACLATLNGDLHGNHWDVLRSLLPLYRAITSVKVGDGRCTLLWHDAWHGMDDLATKFPALHSHCRPSDISVREAVDRGIEPFLVSRLTPRAEEELAKLNVIINTTLVSETPDRRLSDLTNADGKLCTSRLYKILKHEDSHSSSAADFVWQNQAPPRVQFFWWLAVNKRIQCRDNLMKKHIVQSAACEECGDACETTSHILFECRVAQAFWNRIGFHVPVGFDVGDIAELHRPSHVPAKHYTMFVLLCGWQLWKRRNNLIFRGEAQSLNQILMACRAEATLWGHRLPSGDAAVATEWCLVFNVQ